MNQSEFKELLDQKGYSYTVNESQIIVVEYGGVDLGSVTSLPANITFNNGGCVDLGSVTSLPANITFNNGGYVYLGSVTSLPSNVTFKNYGSVYLKSVTSLSDNITFENHGHVYLGSVTSLPEGITFKNHGGVNLRSVTSLLNNVKFENNGWVDLRSLKGKHKYRGKEFDFMQVDESTMIIESSKKKGDFLIHKARYFGGGEIDKLKKCFVAQKGSYYAHGETVKKAIEDVNFKFLQETFNTDELVNRIKESGIVTKNDYRLLTGACSLGCDMFIKEHGISDSISLEKAKSLIHDVYGSDQFNELFAE